MTSLTESATAEVTIMETYASMILVEHGIPAYKDFMAARRDAREVLQQPSPVAAVFHALLDRVIAGPDVEETPVISSHTVTAALEHPNCPPQYLRRALYSVVPEYRVAAFANPSTPEDALIAYWLTTGGAS